MRIRKLEASRAWLRGALAALGLVATAALSLAGALMARGH
jgi:hypothetical protein